jgi:hypothetical protein
MSRGGYRPTAGRPKGAKDKVPRKNKVPNPREVAERAFLAACSDFAQSGEPYKILRQMADDPDPRVRGWAVEKLLAYGVGTPSARPAPAPFNLGELLMQAASEPDPEEELVRPAPARALLPAAPSSAEGKSLAGPTPGPAEPPAEPPEPEPWRWSGERAMVTALNSLGKWPEVERRVIDIEVVRK